MIKYNENNQYLIITKFLLGSFRLSIPDITYIRKRTRISLSHCSFIHILFSFVFSIKSDLLTRKEEVARRKLNCIRLASGGHSDVV